MSNEFQFADSFINAAHITFITLYTENVIFVRKTLKPIKLEIFLSFVIGNAANTVRRTNHTGKRRKTTNIIRT